MAFLGLRTMYKVYFTTHLLARSGHEADVVRDCECEPRERADDTY